MESDARGIKTPEAEARCKECGVPIRADGAGQRPAYCGRGCSSKAYRRRRKLAQESALVAAADSSRESERVPYGDESAERIAQLARVVERTGVGLAEALERGERGMALGVSLSSLLRATESLAVRARTAVRVAEAGRAKHLDGSRESSMVGAAMPGQRAERAAPGSVAEDSGAGAGRMSAAAPPANLDGSREESSVGAAAAPINLDDSREPSSGDPEVEFYLVPLDRRGLPEPTVRRALAEIGPDWELLGWPGVATLHLVLRLGQRVGWVEYGADGTNQWLAVAGDGYLAHEQTHQPLWHDSAYAAARTVSIALLQS